MLNVVDEGFLSYLVNVDFTKIMRLRPWSYITGCSQ